VDGHFFTLVKNTFFFSTAKALVHQIELIWWLAESSLINDAIFVTMISYTCVCVHVY